MFDDWLKRVDGAVIEETASGVKFAERAVTQRLGQPQFRAEVLRAYGGACAITGCAEASVLQAAHISPVAAGGTHAAGNAILLRADVHNLFDLGIITIAPGMTVEVSAEITDGSYRRLAGKKVVAPQGVSKSAFVKALASHRKRHSG